MMDTEASHETQADRHHPRLDGNAVRDRESSREQSGPEDKRSSVHAPAEDDLSTTENDDDNSSSNSDTDDSGSNSDSSSGSSSSSKSSSNHSDASSSSKKSSRSGRSPQSFVGDSSRDRFVYIFHFMENQF